jgi:hypothetical protein
MIVLNLRNHINILVCVFFMLALNNITQYYIKHKNISILKFGPLDVGRRSI